MYTITDSICLKVLSTDCLLVAIGNDLHYYHQIEGETVHKFGKSNFYDKIHGMQSIQKSTTEFHVIVYGGRELALVQIKDHNIVILKTIQLSDWISTINFYEDEPNSFCCLTSHSVALHFSIVLGSGAAERTNIDLIKKLTCEDKSTLYTSFILGTTWNSTVFFGGTALGYVFIWREIDDQIVMLHRLAGHNGVIFSIDCNIEHGLMTTTSDDRSVKIWKINFAKDSSWSNCTIKQMKSLYGHTARVFRCKIIVENNVPYIVSIGEDSNICVWSDGGSLLYRRRFNCGATLWNLDYSSKLKTIFLCGSDGNVREVGLKNVFKRQGWTKEIVSNEILHANEYLAKVKLMANTKIIALTSANRLIYQNDCNDWMVCVFDSYKSCVLEKYERYVALAGYQRASVFQYDEFNSLDLVYEVTDLQSMVRSFTFLNENEYLLSDDTGNCTFISRTSNAKLTFPLLTSKDVYVTAALKHNNFLIVGDRKGHLHLFEIETNEVHHRYQLKQVHGTLGCTVLYSENGNFVTSGHDGTTKVIALNETGKTMSIKLTKKLPVTWMERVICRTDNKKLYAGFNDKHFVLANDECDIVDEIDCGGGHRCWDLSINENDGKFIFIRNKMLYSVILTGYADDQWKFFQLPLFKWHIKSCNLMNRIHMPNGNVVLVSGGDDNILKFNKFNETDESFVEHLGDMVQHISCIKTLAVIEINPTERFVISAGGRAQICISKLRLHANDGITTEEVTNFMLNSTDFQRKRLGKSQMIDFDPETRFMSVTCTEDFQIFTGCSDGYIRQFHFNLTNNEITSIDSIFYGKCILHTHYIRYEELKYLLTMATDGHVCFWETANNSLDCEPFYRLKHHDSGIYSFDIFLPPDNRFIIATGGDDQSTVVSSFLLKKRSVEDVRTKCVHYHTVQVNGIKFSENGACLYSISVDQRLYEVDVQTLTPRQISTSSIADAKGLHLIDSNRILVYGSGIQLILK